MQVCYTDAPSIVEFGRCYNFLGPSRKANAVLKLLTPERIGLSSGAVAEFLCLPLPPAPTRQLLNEVALETVGAFAISDAVPIRGSAVARHRQRPYSGDRRAARRDRDADAERRDRSRG